MKTSDLFRKLLKKEKPIQTTNQRKEEDCKTEVEHEVVYTHAFDRPIKVKFVGTHSTSSKRINKMKIKKVKSNNEDELTM